PELWHEQLGRIEQAQKEGLDIRGQLLSRPLGMLMGHPASMSSFFYRPTFQTLKDLPWAERIEKLNDPATKAQILSEANEQPHMFVKLLGHRYGSMYPLEEPINYLPEPSNSVAALAERDGKDPEEWLYDYLLENDGNRLIYIPATNFTENIETLVTHPHTVCALGDGGAHVGSICDTSANVYLLTHWVKERGAIDLAAAVHMLCRQPAELYSLLDRGLIAEGMKADLNVIDYDALALHTPHIVDDLPAGGSRFLQTADGLVATIKAGEVIFENGQATGALPGRLVRGQQTDPRASSTPVAQQTH
ncbi:MAG: amidohydrolase family protein, partial [Pseudomonadota bacterium]